MAKSARASTIKKNNSALKRRVFGPVEAARNERLSAKLLELAKAPKEEKMEDAELEVASKAAPGKNEQAVTEDMEVDDTTTKKPRSKREVKRLQEARAQRQEKKSRKKPRNQVTFAAKRKSSGRSGSKR